MRTWAWIALGLCGACSAQDAARASAHQPDAALGEARGDDDFGNAAPRTDSGQQPQASPLPPSGALPENLVETETGGYALGAEIADDSMLPRSGSSRQPEGCAALLAIVRDFRGADEEDPHPDFEVFSGKGATTGLVAARLGSDQKPVYASRCEAQADRASCPFGQMTTSEADFDAWYHSSSGVNRAFLLQLVFERNDAVYTFESKAFFPLDDAGFGNAGGKRKHNFGFTTEVHTQFRYLGGEQFSFTGDDDLWVFVNGMLAIDLGGLHNPETATIDLDAQAETLGITTGHSYSLDLFHAERHSAGSSFRVDTTLSFTNCGTVTPELI